MRVALSKKGKKRLSGIDATNAGSQNKEEGKEKKTSFEKELLAHGGNLGSNR